MTHALGAYDFDLPEELIAQHPTQDRASSRLLALDRASGEVADRRFLELPGLLRNGDLLILNDTRVLPARIQGERAKTGGSAEFLFLRESGPSEWEVLLNTRGKPGEGEAFNLSDRSVRAVGRGENGTWRIEVPDDWREFLEAHGHMPLPPYIRKGVDEPADRERYQTVFAARSGAAAAPTAGLHFTDAILEEIRSRGVRIETLTLHVGLGTFRPVKTDDIREHDMHAEWYELPATTAAAIRETKSSEGRVIAVGTTVTRVLETLGPEPPEAGASGETSIYIHPPYTLRTIDGLLTNFHTPKSSLLMLVSAFAGRENILSAYEHAIREKYRFFSYGDAMFIQ